MIRSAKAESRLFSIVGWLTLVFLVAPMVIVVLASMDPGQFFNFPPKAISAYWYAEILTDESWIASLTLTLLVAGLTAILSSIVGGFAGIAVARLTSSARAWVYPFLVAPLIVPVIVLAISFYVLALEFHLVGSVIAFVFANTILTVPLVALLVVGATLRLDERIEFASLSCGASPLRTLVLVTMPLIAPTAIAGGALAFLLALDEIVMSVFLVAPGRTPLAVRLFLQAQTGTAPIVMAASTLLIVASLVVLAVVTASRTILARRGGSIDEAPTDVLIADAPRIPRHLSS